MNKTRFNNVKGFTLVELLVVIAIIAILSIIGLTVFSGVQSNARDARRKSDIDAIAAAIETTRTPGTAYYTSLPQGGFSAGVVPTDGTAAKYVIRTSTAITVPVDPTEWDVVAVPTLTTAGSGESAWTSIPSTGLSSQTTSATGPFYYTSPATSSPTITWKVCARLENSGSNKAVDNTDPAKTHVYCKPSSQ